MELKSKSPYTRPISKIEDIENQRDVTQHAGRAVIITVEGVTVQAYEEDKNIAAGPGRGIRIVGNLWNFPRLSCGWM